MALMNLPLELFQEIVTQSIAVVGLAGATNLRVVNSMHFPLRSRNLG
jgi:hypothetical protein